MRRFKMNNVEIEFGEPEQAVTIAPYPVDTSAIMVDNDTTHDTDVDHEVDADVVLDSLEDLQLSDPLAYEQEIHKLMESNNAKD